MIDEAPARHQDDVTTVRETMRHGNMPAEHAPAGSVTVERRRPGRPTHVSPALVELLRWRPDANAENPADHEDDHAMSAPQGILVGALLGVTLWIGGFWLVIDLLR